MIISILTESRRHPEKNPKINVYEFLKSYSTDPKIHIHTTTIDKVGIYPKSPESNDSPLGIYAYRLTDIWQNYIEPYNTGKYASNPRGLSMLPYYGGNITYVLKETQPTITAQSYTSKDLQNDIDKLVDWYNLSDGDMKSIKRIAKTNLNFRHNLPVSMLWAITKTLNSQVIDEFDDHTSVNIKDWNTLLRKLGYQSFSDNGYGYIHGAESIQSIFLSSKSFKIIDKHQKFIKKEFDLGAGEKYQSIPKRLKMKSIPNTFFYNNTPEEFNRVIEWNVDYMRLLDIKTFARFLPKSATGKINKLFVSGSNVGVVGTVISNLEFLKNNKNIHIDNLHVGLHDWVNVVHVLKKMPDIKNIKNIEISAYLNIDNIYLKSLPVYVTDKLLIK